MFTVVLTNTGKFILVGVKPEGRKGKNKVYVTEPPKTLRV